MQINKLFESTFLVIDDITMKVEGRTEKELVLSCKGVYYYVEPKNEEAINIFNELHKPLSGIK